jgi:rod shape-determining protein MreD
VTATRAFAFVALGYLALLLLSSLKAAVGVPWHLPTPEVMLLLVLYLGLRGRGSTTQLVVLGLCCGYLADLFAGSPKGTEAFALAVIALCARAASSRLLVGTAWQVVAVAGAAALGHSVVIFLLASLYAEPMGALKLLPGVALMTGLMAPPVFALLRRIDRRFLSDPHRLHIARAPLPR